MKIILVLQFAMTVKDASLRIISEWVKLISLSDSSLSTFVDNKHGSKLFCIAQGASQSR